MTISPLSILAVILFLSMLHWSAGREVAWFAGGVLAVLLVLRWVLG